MQLQHKQDMSAKTNRTDVGVDPSEMWPKVEKLVYRLAHRAEALHGIPYEDALSEAQWGFMRACKRYKHSSEASFASWCHLVISRRLQTLGIKRAKERLDFMEVNDDLLQDHAPAPTSLVQDLLAGLSEDAREMLSLLLETPQELLEDVVSPRTLLRRVKDRLQAQEGRNRRKVNRAAREIRSTYQQLVAA